MYTLGHTFVPEPIHAGGLRYHGAAPIVSALTHDGIMKDPKSSIKFRALEAGMLFRKG
jgi:tryptophan synthase beta chain